MTTAEADVTYKTCKVTIVAHGTSDKVIKIFPAEHEKEKIWLNERPGIERWNEVKRFMNNYAERGSRTLEPIRYHSPGNTSIVEIEEKDIPIVKLEAGYVFEKPKEEEKPAPPKPVDAAPVATGNAVLENRVTNLEGLVSQIAVGMNVLLQNANKPAPVIAAPAVMPAAEPFQAMEGVPCGQCDKVLKSPHLLKMHVGRFHKEK